MNISLVIITRDAGEHLEKCLDSVQGIVDDIIILDSGSKDNTQFIAPKYNARFIYQDWLGFGKQKQKAVELAANDWVLCLDADEYLSDELRESINKIDLSSNNFAYYLCRCNIFFKKPLRHGAGYPDNILRLFNRRFANWNSNDVHESVVTKQQAKVLKGDLFHNSSSSLSKYIEKQNNYTDIQSANSKKKSSFFRAVISPLWFFIKYYIIKGGFLDGFAGFAHISIGAITSFIKYLKIYEKNL